MRLSRFWGYRIEAKKIYRIEIVEMDSDSLRVRQLNLVYPALLQLKRYFF